MFRSLLFLGVLMGAETCAFMAAPPPAMEEEEDCYAVVLTDDETGVFTTPIYAAAGGGDITHGEEVGALSAEVVGDYLAVTYDITAEDIYLGEVHFWIGTDIYESPLTDGEHGGSAFGHFPYSYEEIYETSYTVYVPLEDLGFACPGDDADFVAIAHAALVTCAEWDGEECVEWEEYETAMAYGTDLPDTTRWGWYFDLTLHCVCGDDPEETCETAFAYNEDTSLCFSVYDFARWGWTNGPLEEGAYTFVMRAGASHCEDGEEVGEMTLSFWDGEVDYEYTWYEGFEAAETQTYVGLEPIPSHPKTEAPTVAPGQYTIADDLTGDDPVYMIGHAVVCGEFAEDYEDWDEEEEE